MSADNIQIFAYETDMKGSKKVGILLHVFSSVDT